MPAAANSLSARVCKDTERPDGDAEVAEIQKSKRPPTTKKRLIDARFGQGFYRTELLKVDKRCRITGLSDTTMLVASHILPWRSGTDAQRLDGNNGLLLAPHVDRLFDRGHITFTSDGRIEVASSNAKAAMKAWNIDPMFNVGAFNDAQHAYLAYHRKHIFKNPKAARDRSGEK